MGGRALPYLALALAWLAAACGDSATDAPTFPSFAPPGSGSCNYNTLASLAKTEFGNNSNEAKLAGDIKSFGAGTTQATYAGYLILDAIATKYASPQPSTSNASLLATTLLGKCMNVGGATVPASFENELGSEGAFAVRGRLFATPSVADDRPVFSHDLGWSLAPPPPNQTWLAATTGLSDSLAHLFLAYGQPVDNPDFSDDDLVGNRVFNWSTIPDVEFAAPGVLVSECTQPANFLQHNAAGNGPEVLGYLEPVCTNAASAAVEPAPRSFAERIFRFFRPAPAFAALAATTGTGGTKSKLSPFGLIDPNFVNLAQEGFDWRKSGNAVGVKFSSLAGQNVKYQILSGAGTEFLQPGILIWLEAIGNSGVNVDICFNWALTDATGLASFPDAFLNKAGGYTIQARTTGTSWVTSIPVVPPGASVPSKLINVKNGTVGASCPTYHAGDTVLPQ